MRLPREASVVGFLADFVLWTACPPCVDTRFVVIGFELDLDTGRLRLDLHGEARVWCGPKDLDS